MAGIFSKNNRPKLSGAYTNWGNLQAAAPPPAPGTAVALAVKGDWGPVGEPVRCPTLGQVQAVFGPSDNTELYLAARSAFQGEGFDGFGGAGEVVLVRHAGGSAPAVKASIAVAKTGGGAGVTISAKYPGTFGNGATGGLSVEVTDASGSIDRLTVKLNGVEVERYDFAQTDITDLAAQINANSDWVTAGTVTSGTALDQATDGNLAGGTNGTVSTADYSAAFTKLDTQPFAVFSLHGVIDSGIRTAFKTWVADSNVGGHRFFGILGGARIDDATAELAATAATRSAAHANPNILNVDGVVLRDLVNGPASAEGEIIVDGSTLTSRMAGILAARGEYASITAARLADTEIIAGRSIAEQATAFDEGIVTFGRDSHSRAPVLVRVGLTTWTTAEATSAQPYLTYRQPKYVRTMQGIETDLTSYTEEQIIGRRPINAATRDAVVGEAKRILAEREKQGVILPGWTVGIDQNPPPTDEDEFIALAITAKFGRALEQVYFSISVS